MLYVTIRFHFAKKVVKPFAEWLGLDVQCLIKVNMWAITCQHSYFKMKDK